MTGSRANLFRDRDTPPSWAQLTRLAGDRAAILFEDLRRRLGKIDGLREELYYHEAESGWTPRYRLGEQVLCTAHILPGILEASLELEVPLRESVLNSPRLAAVIREAVRRAPVGPEGVALRLRLSNASLVRSFAAIVIMKSRFDRTPGRN